MPYKLGWYQANRVVFANVCEVTLQEVRCLNEAIAWHLDSGSKPTHLIIDLSEMRRHPTNVIHLKQTLTFMKHPHLGYMVVVGATALASTLTTILMRLFGVKYRMFQNMNEALTFLRQYDRSMIFSIGGD